MKIITFDDIKKKSINPEMAYNWAEEILKKREESILPTKTRINLEGSDYFNSMPGALPKENYMGIKLITRNQARRDENQPNMDSQILLYSYDKAKCLALMDGNYITTLRTAAIAVHSLLNSATDFNTISMIGLGNIGTEIGEILFYKTKNMQYNVRLYNYKDQAANFKKRFEEKYKNINFTIVDNYEDLMRDSDVVISSITYAESDFCDESIYKKGVTIIPVHMRGFMECDKTFDNIIVSDLDRAKEFKYYHEFKKMSYTDDVFFKGKKVREDKDDRVIIYNLGLAITDIFFASKIYEELKDEVATEIKIEPTDIMYM